MKKIIGTGLSGLVGSRIVELLSDTYEFEDISRKTGTDIADAQGILHRLENSSADVVLHLAARTDVDGCESEKALGEQSDAWKVNVIGTEHVVDACKKLGKKLVYFSTDMVFSGDQKLGEFYSEEDTPNPQNFYATTKFEAEKRVLTEKENVVVRIAYPYRAQFEKKEYVRAFKWLLEEKKTIQAVNNHYFTPTFIDDIAPVITHIITDNFCGVLHANGEQTVSPFLVAKAVAKEFHLDERLISPTTREFYFKDRAIRGFNLSLKSAKMNTLGVQMHSFSEGLEIVKEQIV